MIIATITSRREMFSKNIVLKKISKIPKLAFNFNKKNNTIAVVFLLILPNN